MSSPRGVESPADAVPMTLEAFRRLPEGRGYSLLDGLCCREPMARFSHQDAAANVFIALRRHAEAMGSGLALPPIDVYLDDRNVVVPDAAYLSEARRAALDERGLHGVAPDLCVEVLSPSTASRDLGVKARLYARYGCREYWIVDVEKGRIHVMHPDAASGMAGAGVCTAGDAVVSAAVPGLRVRVRDVLPAWRPPSGRA